LLNTTTAFSSRRSWTTFLLLSSAIFEELLPIESAVSMCRREKKKEAKVRRKAGQEKTANMKKREGQNLKGRKKKEKKKVTRHRKQTN
jgi:hypothetical protein